MEIEIAWKAVILQAANPGGLWWEVSGNVAEFDRLMAGDGVTASGGIPYQMIHEVVTYLMNRVPLVILPYAAPAEKTEE